MAFGWQGNFGFWHPHARSHSRWSYSKGWNAYQSDLGMTGPRESVLGRDIDACLGRFWICSQMPRCREGDVGLQGCLVETAESTLVTSILRAD